MYISLTNAIFFRPITEIGEINTSIFPEVDAVALPSSYILEINPFAPNLGASLSPILNGFGFFTK